MLNDEFWSFHLIWGMRQCCPILTSFTTVVEVLASVKVKKKKSHKEVKNYNSYCLQMT